MKRGTGLAVACLALVFFCTPSVEATFVTSGPNDATGNSGFTGDLGVQGWVNFAVYSNGDGGNWLTELGLTPANVLAIPGTYTTGFEKRVFFFQITRADPAGIGSGIPLENLLIPNGEDPWLHGGVLGGLVFEEAGGAAVVGEAAGTNTLGTAAAAGGTSLDGALDSTPFVANGAANNPSVISAVATGIRFIFPTTTFGADEHSSVFFVASESNPLVTITKGQTTVADPFATQIARAGQLGGGGPTVQVPVSNPEPGSLILLSLAGAGGLGMTWRRRRKQKQQEAS